MDKAGKPAPPTGASNPTAATTAIGQELASLVSMQQQILDTVKRQGTFTPAHLGMIEDSLQQMHQVAIRSQQLARLAGGTLRQSHERLKLHEILEEIIESRRKTWRGAGVQVDHFLKPVEVIVDPGLLFGLLEAAVDWAMEQGKVLIISLTLKTWPEHALLKLTSSQGIHLQGEGIEASSDTLSWHLLVETAKALGANVARAATDDKREVLIEFPRTVQQLQGVTAIELDVAHGVGPNSTSFGDSRPMVGNRLLLISNDTKLQRQVDDVCVLLGLKMASTADSARATRYCEMDLPDMIVVQDKARDDEFEELRRELLKRNPHFLFVEVTTQPNQLGISMDRDTLSTVSIADVRARLPSILSMERARP
jgi:hypothetical protein